MSGQPDPKPERRERPARRRRDIARQGVLGECWGGCGKAGANRHHLIPKDFEIRGPDEDWNLIPLCGTGTSRCHGAFHGNPYVDESGTRHTTDSVGRAIATRLVNDQERATAVINHLALSPLVYRLFERVLRSPVAVIVRNDGHMEVILG